MRRISFFSITLSVMLIGSTMAQQPKAKGLAELKTAPVGQRTNLLKQLQSDPSTDLKKVALAMEGADPVQKNLLLGVAQTILARDPSKTTDLEIIVSVEDFDPAARYWAFTELTRGDAKKRDAMLQKMLDDPSLELRYEAVKLAQSEIKGLKEGGTQTAKVIAAYTKLLESARLPEQVQQIADAMKELGETVDLLNHFGFVSKWQIMASFDNRNKVGFNEAYAPEKAYLASQSIDPKAEYEGKEGKKATWQLFETKEPDGAVDLNPVYSNEKGAVAYAYSEFNAGKALDCEVRLGCINANKVWVNGKQVMSNDVYHAGSQIDQYTAPVKLKAGKNTILVKICQNEQTEQWAQDWKFQLRFSDASGLAIAQAK